MSVYVRCWQRSRRESNTWEPKVPPGVGPVHRMPYRRLPSGAEWRPQPRPQPSWGRLFCGKSEVDQLPAIRSTSPARYLYWGLDWSQGSRGFCCLPSSLPSRCKSSPSRGRKGISRRDSGGPMRITPGVCGGGSRVTCGTTSLPPKW